MSDDVEYAKAYFESMDVPNFNWTARRQLRILLLDDLEHQTPKACKEARAYATQHLRALAGSEAIAIAESSNNNQLVLLASGPGAEQAARILRDDVSIHFAGSTSIPQCRTPT